jgi:hypothetical protein
MNWACRTHGRDEKYEILVRNHEGKKQRGRPRRRWEDHIRMDLGEIRWEGVDRLHLAQDKDRWRALVNISMNLRVPQKAGKLTSYVTIRFSRKTLPYEVS